MSQKLQAVEDVSDQEIAEALAERFHANELRSWMSQNGLERKRGANKMSSARMAVEQDREGIAEYLIDNGALDVDIELNCRYYSVCGNTTAGANVEMCDECTDVSRANRRSSNPEDPDDHESLEDYMAELHRIHG